MAEKASLLMLTAERFLPSHIKTPEVRGRALELFENGWGYKRVASTLGLKASTVRDWGRQWRRGQFSAKLSSNQYRYTDAAASRVMEWYEAGVDINAIARGSGLPVEVCMHLIQMWERRNRR